MNMDIGKAQQPIKDSGIRNNLIMLIALIGLAFNLRSPLTSLSPIIGELQLDLGISSTMAGLLTTIPILCFGILTPLASNFIARIGIDIAVATTLCGVAIGTVIRSMDGITMALIGTLILGGALTIGNIVSIMVIARDFSKSSNTVTGVYTSALNIGTMLTSAFTAPLAIFWGWRMATTLWVVLAVMAGIVWVIVFLRSFRVKIDKVNNPSKIVSGKKTSDNKVSGKGCLPVWKRKFVWLLVIAFAAHLFLYYAITAWLPAYLIETSGMTSTSAGIASSAFQILALVGAFGVPALAAKGRVGNVALLIGVALCWLAIPVGLYIAPLWWPLWALIGGIAQGGGFTVLFMLIVDHSHDIDDNRRVSTLVQGMGYSIASLGPIVVGSLHQYFKQWLPGFTLLVFIAIVMISMGIIMYRDVYVKQTKTAEKIIKIH